MATYPNLSYLSKPSGVVMPPRKMGEHLAYQEYVARTIKAGGKPMSSEEFSLSQRK